jgi:hypothetical protein
VNYEIVGIKVDGANNLFEGIEFERADSNSKILLNKSLQIISGAYNRLIPLTGAPTNHVSYTVGDGIKSFGDYNGVDGIEAAIYDLPHTPGGSTAVLSSSSGSYVTFTTPSTSLTFNTVDLYHYVNIIDSTPSGDNIGSYKIVDVIEPLPSHSVVLERTDGLTFTDATSVQWEYVAGSKVIILPGTYNDFEIRKSLNDLEIEAWGNGSDVVITAASNVSTVVTVEGNRNRIKGLRLTGADPLNGIGFHVSGQGNTFENNVIETAKRYLFESTAVDNKVIGDYEDHARSFYSVGTSLSRADFVGTSTSGIYSFTTALQAAIDAAAEDTHIKEVRIGAGDFILIDTLTVPSNLKISGSGYYTHLVGGSFAAMTLDGGNQTISGIRFDTFTNCITAASAVSGVFAYGNWLESAPIDTVNISGNLTMNI